MPIFVSKEKFDQEIAKRVAESCDQIIFEMGAELHDDLIQKLSILRFHIDRIERSSIHPEEIQSLVIKMRTDFERIIRSIKTISRRLLPPYIENESLGRMLSLLCQNMEQPGAANIHFEDQFSCTLDNSYKIHLLRIVQELIHNSLKHSSAWHIWVRLTSNTNLLIIEVEDDGIGTTKITEFVDHLRRKNNTLNMRTKAIGATINYLQGTKGLLAKVSLRI